MKKIWVMLSIIFLIFIVVGCTKESSLSEVAVVSKESESATLGTSKTPNTIIKPTDIQQQSNQMDSPEDTSVTSVTNVDQFPTIKVSASPTDLYREEHLTLSINAEDDVGIEKLMFESSQVFWNNVQYTFDCNLAKTCSNTWDLVTWEEGVNILTAWAVDSKGKESEKSTININIGPYRYQVEDTTTSTTSTSSSTTNSNSDWYTPPTCGNNVCENGESYKNCDNDCEAKATIGTSPGNGYCESGESIENAPKDCTTIHPTCGNKICDSGEDRLSCYYDCKNGETIADSSCSSNSDCGYKQICTSGKCQSVQCTNDGQCSGCKRCSSNRCVNCGYGAAGYCTC
ncbi:MAG: hypothetical protein ABIH82_01080 [Candidatus Woesearchaeota archaeon]